MAGAGPSLAEGGGLWLGAACLAQEESKAQKDFTESYYILVGMAPQAQSSGPPLAMIATQTPPPR